MSSVESSAPRGRVGRVDRARMQKSVIVVVETLVRHPRYGKYLRMRSRIMAHDAEGRCREGDLVRIVPSRKRAKRKAWDVAEIVAREPDAIPAVPKETVS